VIFHSVLSFYSTLFFYCFIFLDFILSCSTQHLPTCSSNTLDTSRYAAYRRHDKYECWESYLGQVSQYIDDFASDSRFSWIPSILDTVYLFKILPRLTRLTPHTYHTFLAQEAYTVFVVGAILFELFFGLTSDMLFFLAFKHSKFARSLLWEPVYFNTIGKTLELT
jgi:hypothetical protein